MIGTFSFPDMPTLTHLSWQELRNLTITQVKWNGALTIGFTISDSQSCKAGKENFINSHSFDQTKKITKVEVIIHKIEYHIIRINFYNHQQRLVAAGHFHDGYVN